MSYVTVEVEIEDGKITPTEPTRLPQKGKGLLTVLEADPESVGMDAKPLTQLEAFEALQKHLKLDAKKAAEWMAIVRDARR